jgi:hypothetical protein
MALCDRWLRLRMFAMRIVVEWLSDRRVYQVSSLSRLASVHMDMNRNPSLRQARNFLLINLAITDLGLLVTNNSLHAVASFNKQWPFGQKGKLSRSCAAECQHLVLQERLMNMSAVK